MTRVQGQLDTHMPKMNLASFWTLYIKINSKTDHREDPGKMVEKEATHLDNNQLQCRQHQFNNNQCRQNLSDVPSAMW